MMKNFLFRLYLAGMKFYCIFTGMETNAIVILNGAGRSGSNGYLFYKWLQLHHPEYQTTLVEPWPSSHLSLATWQRIAAARYVITTHQPFKVKRHQLNLQFWHGIPLKRMGTMANNTKRRDNQRNERLWHRTADVVSSSSDLYETLMSSCMGIETHKYQKLGFPRLDALQHPAKTKAELLHDLFGVTDASAQLGIYLPTFRYELAQAQLLKQLQAGNFFAFSDGQLDDLNQALVARHQYLVVKLHPYEQRLLAPPASRYSHIAVLNQEWLSQQQLDLYEILGSTDFLITDFSSVYFDYLLLDRPLVFVTNLLPAYQQTRGLLMGPYEQVTPGVKVDSQAALIAALGQLDSPAYQQQRQQWRNLTQQVSGDSCQRIFDYMTRAM